jgi:hypothetical protein
MTVPQSVVAPPIEEPAPFGLFSAAHMLPLTGHEEWGISYDIVCGDPPTAWPGACRVSGPPEPATRTITITLTGQHIVGPPEHYTVTASATVDGGPARTVDVTYAGAGPFPMPTNGTPVIIADNPTPTSGILEFTDRATGETAQFSITQAADGSLDANTVVIPVIDAPEIPAKTGGYPATNVTASPFAVYAAETCWMGLSNREVSERARYRLSLIEEVAVERAFWTGEWGNRPALATSNPVILPDPGTGAATPVDLTTAMSLLEAWIGAGGTRGFLHVSRRVGAVASDSHTVRRVGDRLETLLGNVWIFGGGYPATGPTGQPAPGPNQVWMFATRQPTVRRTEVIVPGEIADGTALNFRSNDAFVLAERVYIVDFPCRSAAVLVDLSTCRC